jgi:Cys-rich four helix bundle protein (predicted Tat secretion target)
MTNVPSVEVTTGCLSAAVVSRRSTLTAGLAAGAAFAATVAGSSRALAGDKPDPHAGMDHSQMDHSQLDHSKMDHGAMDMGSAPAKHQTLIDKALHCVNTGEVCLNHCLALLSKGDTSITDCVRTVSVLLPMCATLAKLGALDADRLKEFAKVCRDVCADCEKECNKHKDHHAVCKACAESCAACVKECDKLAA